MLIISKTNLDQQKRCKTFNIKTNGRCGWLQRFSPGQLQPYQPQRRQAGENMCQILIIDNNEHIVRMFQEVLSREGHNVTIAQSGLTARQLIDRNKFDIAFIDLELPDISGLDILRHIKNKYPDTVASVITGNSDIRCAIESITAGVFRYLKKPFDVDDILEVTRLSVQERKKSKSYLPRSFEGINLRHFAVLASDLMMLIPALILGFILQQRIFHWQEIPIIWGAGEIIYMLLSFACCYSFIFLSSYGYNLRDRESAAGPIYKAFSASYILFAAILFFVTDFIYGRLVLLFGFAIGTAGLWLSRNIILPHMSMIFDRKQEGPRQIMIKSGEAEKIDKVNIIETEISGILKRTQSKPQPAKKLEIDKRDTISENDDDAPYTGDDWGSRLIHEFRNNRSKSAGAHSREKIEQVK